MSHLLGNISTPIHKQQRVIEHDDELIKHETFTLTFDVKYHHETLTTFSYSRTAPQQSLCLSAVATIQPSGSLPQDLASRYHLPVTGNDPSSCHSVPTASRLLLFSLHPLIFLLQSTSLGEFLSRSQSAHHRSDSFICKSKICHAAIHSEETTGVGLGSP